MLITLTGPTCSGKSTIEAAFVKRCLASKLTSFTTRPPRSGEVEGKDYFFLTEPPEESTLVEHIQFNGSHYGLTAAEVNKAKEGLAIVVVEPKGTMTLDNYCDTNSIDIFKVYLDQPQEILIERFLTRFRGDILSPIDYSAKRLSNMLYEREWINEYVWDMVVWADEDLTGKHPPSPTELAERIYDAAFAAPHYKGRKNR